MKDQNARTIVRTKGTGNRFCFVSRVTDGPVRPTTISASALKYGIDREKIIKQVYNGYAVAGQRPHARLRSIPTTTPRCRSGPIDPDKAAFHFKKAGDRRTRIELQTSEGAWGSGASTAPRSTRKSLKKAGIDLDVKKVSADGYWDNVWLKVPFCAVYWGRRADRRPDLLARSSVPTSDWNDSNWKTPGIRQARHRRPRRARRGASARRCTGKCQEMISDDGGMICFAIARLSRRLLARRSRASSRTPRYDLNDQRLAEKAWFA